VIGQGFALPLDVVATIAQSSMLYSQWMVEKQLRPRIMTDDNEQQYWKT
jgi:hypothetical protein